MAATSETRAAHDCAPQCAAAHAASAPVAQPPAGRGAFDWNSPGDALAAPALPLTRWSDAMPAVRLVDETLRDGLQNASGYDPPVERKIELLHAMAAIGVDVVSVGLPAAAAEHAKDVRRLVEEIVGSRLPLVPTAAARTVEADVAAVARVADGAGVAVEVYSFIGSSPIRQLAESWDTGFLVGCITKAALAARRFGLPFTLVTEDTTRSKPETLRAMYRAAIDAGARRICLADTSGHATPRGVAELVRFVQALLHEWGADQVGLDWHGHNDRGLALSNALWAAAFGVERIHGTGLGVGERVGNPPTELLARNFFRLGWRADAPPGALEQFCSLSALVLGWPEATSLPSSPPRRRRDRERAR